MNDVVERELVIVGGGPAGMAAAIEATSAKVQTTIIDEMPELGGQIFRQAPPAFSGLEQSEDLVKGLKLIADTRHSGTEIRLSATVSGVFDRDLLVIQGGAAQLLRANRIIVATGAYDRPVPLPGWTLPGVMTAGGAQALLKTQGVAPGQRILVAGSGPLLLAFSAHLLQAEANVIAVAEAAPFPRPRVLLALAAAAVRNPDLMLQGLRYLWILQRHRVPPQYSTVLVRVEGEGQVERAILARVDRQWRPVHGTERTLDVDTVCLGYGFFPSTELTLLLGCEHEYHEGLGGFVPVHDEDMRASEDWIFVAGDGSGVSGSAIAIEQGRIAAINVAHDLGHLSAPEAAERLEPVVGRLTARLEFRSAVLAMYPVGDGVYELASNDTIICRCEDVTLGQIRLAAAVAASYDPNVLKSLTRTTMGLCQGRNCSRQLAMICARSAGVSLSDGPTLRPRTPLKPIPVDCLGEDSRVLV